MYEIWWLLLIVTFISGILIGWHLKQWDCKVNLKKGNFTCLKK